MNAASSYLVYVLFAAGGVALFLAMPGTTALRRRVGFVLGLSALAGLFALLATRHVGPHGTNVFFYGFAALAVVAAGRVVTHPVATYSAAYFALVVLSTAVLLVTMQAEFLAAALVIIYAGAILVTYAFVIMLAQQAGAQAEDLRTREPLLAILASFVLMGAVAGQLDTIGTLPAPPEPVAVAHAGTVDVEVAGAPGGVPRDGNTIGVGRAMFGTYVVTVQVAGLLLLVAMVGAIAIARQRVPVEMVGPPPAAPGEIGKQVPPF